MIVYDNILPEYFYKKLTNIEGKYALNTSEGNYYRFTYPSYQIAIDFENIFLGVGIPHQCDIMFFNKRAEHIKYYYNQFKNPEYSILVYFINENYKGGQIMYKEQEITPVFNKAVYFDSGINLEIQPVIEGTQYLLITYFRKNLIKKFNTII